MANQTANLIVQTPQGRRVIRLTLVDTDATASTFPAIGGAAVYSLPYPIQVLDCIGNGSAAPSTALQFQLKVNGSDMEKYINGANAFDPNSTADGRVGALRDTQIAQGANLQFIGRA
jgi:hypothetical protein